MKVLGQSVAKIKVRSKSNRGCPFKIASEKAVSDKENNVKMSKSFMCIAGKKHQSMNPKRSRSNVLAKALAKARVSAKEEQNIEEERLNAMVKENLRRVVQRKRASKKPLKSAHNCTE